MIKISLYLKSQIEFLIWTAKLDRGKYKKWPFHDHNFNHSVYDLGTLNFLHGKADICVAVTSYPGNYLVSILSALNNTRRIKLLRKLFSEELFVC